MSNSTNRGFRSGVTRTLKLEERTVFKNRQYVTTPRLVLQGKWFMAAGFLPGYQVEVEVGNGVLTLKPKTHGN